MPHPLFARMYARVAPGLERAGAAAHRQELLAGLAGRVVEVGAGSGLSFAHYPPAVTRVVAVEPEPYLRAIAVRAAASAPVDVVVVDGTAEDLPLEPGSVDAAVSSLVLCSVADLSRACAELRRVLPAGGRLHFYEHVRADAPRQARLQDLLDPLWSALAGGCHPNRDTPAILAESGFAVEGTRRFEFRPSCLAAPVSPHVIGTARVR